MRSPNEMDDAEEARRMVMTNQLVYLEALEKLSSEQEARDFYLWPRTPLNSLQEKIVERVGVSDYEAEDPRSRPAMIIRELRRIQKKGLLPLVFSVLDIACGDALVLWQIKRVFPGASCFGVDSNKGKVDSHERVQRQGVVLYRAFIQHLFKQDVGHPFDVVLMLNTYRGWESADLRDHEKDLPNLADAWFSQNSRFTILTAVDSQIRGLEKLGFRIRRMGPGEDDSTMICLSRMARRW